MSGIFLPSDLTSLKSSLIFWRHRNEQKRKPEDRAWLLQNGVCSCKSHHRLFARSCTCSSNWLRSWLLWLRGWDYYPKANIGWKSHSSLGQQTHFQILSSFLGVISPDLHPHLFVWHICKGLDTVLQSHFHLKDLSPSQTRLDARQ